MEQTTGIEPAYSAWEADILPMNYVCVYVNRHKKDYNINTKVHLNQTYWIQRHAGGGTGESRTRVRKPIRSLFYMLSLST